MRRWAGAMALGMVGSLAAPFALADPPLRGELVAADTHGQPVCATRRALSDYTMATIRHERLAPAIRDAGCRLLPYGTRVTVLEDLPPFGSRMHMLRVAAATSLQRFEGFTWSVGLYDPRRFQPFSPLGEYFPRSP